MLPARCLWPMAAPVQLRLPAAALFTVTELIRSKQFLWAPMTQYCPLTPQATMNGPPLPPGILILICLTLTLPDWDILKD